MCIHLCVWVSDAAGWNGRSGQEVKVMTLTLLKAGCLTT